MLTTKMEQALIRQVNAEWYSAYLYLAMEAYFKSLNLSGFANWMRCQTQEEMFHGIKIYDHVFERGGRTKLSAIETPPEEWASPLAAFEAALEHEKKITAMINDLVDIAVSEKDHATNNFLQWYVAEQVEEEASVDEVIQNLKLTGEAPGGLFMIDKELAARVFTMPVSTKE